MKNKNKNKKQNAEFQNKVVKPMVDVLESIAGDMLKTLETKEVKVEVPETVIVPVTPVAQPFKRFDFVDGDSCEKVIESLPYKEDEIHPDDVNTIKDYLKGCVKLTEGKKGSKSVKLALEIYLLKLFDGTAIGEKSPKVEAIFKSKKLGNIVIKALNKEDKKNPSRMSDFDQDDEIRKLQKEVKDLQKGMKHLEKMMEFIKRNFTASSV